VRQRATIKRCFEEIWAHRTVGNAPRDTSGVLMPDVCWKDLLAFYTRGAGAVNGV